MPAIIEPKATLVWIDGDGMVHVQSPNKSPFALSHAFSRTSPACPREQIVIEPSAIGGDFGSKGWTTDEFPCYYLAKATAGRSNGVSSYTERAALDGVSIRHKSSRSSPPSTTTGAFSRIARPSSSTRRVRRRRAFAVPDRRPDRLPSVPYEVPHVSISVHSVYTNTSPATHVRSPGRHRSCLRLGTTRRPDGGEAGWTRSSCAGATSFARTAIWRDRRRDPSLRWAAPSSINSSRRSRPDHPPPPDRAWGIRSARATPATARRDDLTLQPDGTIDIRSGVPDQGAGGHTVAQRVVAATLAIRAGTRPLPRGSTRAKRRPDSAAPAAVA